MLFSKKLYVNCGGRTSNKIKIKIEIISAPTVYTVCACCISNSRAIKIYINEDANHLVLSHKKFFQKTKRDLEKVSLPFFLRNFPTKILVMLYSTYQLNFISNYLFFLRYCAMCMLELFVSQIATS